MSIGLPLHSCGYFVGIRLHRALSEASILLYDIWEVYIYSKITKCNPGRPCSPECFIFPIGNVTTTFKSC